MAESLRERYDRLRASQASAYEGINRVSFEAFVKSQVSHTPYVRGSDQVPGERDTEAMGRLIAYCALRGLCEQARRGIVGGFHLVLPYFFQGDTSGWCDRAAEACGAVGVVYRAGGVDVEGVK